VSQPSADARTRSRHVVGGLLVLAVLSATAACGGAAVQTSDVVSDTDLARAAVLSADPVLVGAVFPPDVRPGRVRTARLGWDRTEVRARLFASHAAAAGAGPTPAAVEAKLAESFATLRAGGWTIHWTLCVPPQAAPTPSPSSTPAASTPAAVLRSGGWQWFATAYKIADGVSYWSMLSAELIDVGDAWVDIVLRAPQASDPPNLFPDKPKALAAGKTCAEDRREGTNVEQSGSPAIVREWWPFPSQSRSPDPQRR